MKIHVQSLMGVVVFAASCGGLQAFVPNAVVNGSFEAGNLGFTSAYAYTPNPIELQQRSYAVVPDVSLVHYLAVSFPDHTTGSGLMLAVNNSDIIGDIIWQQTVNVQPNTQHTFSLWYANWDSNAADPSHARPIFRVEIDTFLSPEILVMEAPGTWNEYSLSWTSGASSSATIRVLNGRPELNGNDLAFDDISLTPIPEPSAGLTLLLATACLFIRTKLHKRA